MPEETISSRSVYKGKILDLKVDDVKLSDGQIAKREIIEHVPCVTIVPVCDNGNILLIKQFRKAAEKELIEVPAGCIEKGETAEETVVRELQEEAGYKPANLTKIGGFYSSPGYCTEYLHAFIAQNLTKSRLHAEDTDSIEVIEVPLTEALEMIDSGIICDGKTIVSLLLYSKLA